MLNFPEKGRYKIVFIEDKTGVIASDHKNKRLFISKNIKLNITDDGKLCAMFPNLNPEQKPSGKKYNTDCSIIISDPSCFNHCIQKDGTYQLSGSNVTFNGTDNGDTLILSECENSKINMGEGNDIVLYRHKKILNNDINLGGGNNIFTAAYTTDKDFPLQGNKILSEDGQDYIHLRYALGNTISVGGGDDTVEIEGIPQSKFPDYFKNNSVNMGDGNDTVNVFGKFDRFWDNRFYLGKGTDKFCASINPEKDAVTETDYQSKLAGYLASVKNNEVYAKDGNEGLFEKWFGGKDVFDSKTHSANKLILTGFESDNVNCKPLPHSQQIIPKKNEPVKLSKASIRENCKSRYYVGSLGAMLFNDPKMQEAAFKALDDYVRSMLGD